jgi:hypothetical protein
LHFRCGDLAYTGSKAEQEKEFVFQENSGRPISAYSSYMQGGYPKLLAECALEIEQNMTRHYSKQQQQQQQLLLAKDIPHLNYLLLHHHYPHQHHSQQQHHLSHQQQQQPYGVILYYLTSDSEVSSRQMEQVLHSNFTLQAPNGCHIEMDHSYSCLLLTASQWFIMALSDVFVAQTLTDHFGTPTR